MFGMASNFGEGGYWVFTILMLIAAAVLYVVYFVRELRRKSKSPNRLPPRQYPPSTRPPAEQPPTPADREKKEDDDTFELFMLDDIERRRDDE